MKPQVLAIVILALMTGGCAVSEKTASPRFYSPDPNELDTPHADNEFDLFENELAGQVVKVADPLEPSNRVMYGVNDVLYFWVAKPVTHLYADVVPKPVRIGIGNFFCNLATPARLVNCLLQGKCSAAGRELHRFVVNTTAGALGFGDPAHDRYGLKPAEEDLGQTLAVYGLVDGFYVVWPLLGPSTLRDSVGMVGDQFLNPVRYVEPAEASIGISAVSVTNQGSFHIGEYEAFKSAAVDPYVAMRGAYLQYRSKRIKE
ncbi:MAG: VacJ family lipoprotein [Sedimentisphaerales bacterium]|nr:VacJ family lipoprotein [Sedimentisphaerales bacterium]